MGGVNVKKGLWATLFNYLGIVVGYANTFWLMPKYMDLDKIGEFRVIYGTMLLLVPFIQLGSSNVVLKFSPKQPKSYLSNLFSLLTYLQLTLFFGILLIYTLFPDILLNLIDSNVSFNKGYLYAAFPILLTTTLVNFFVAILRSQFREISASFSQTIGVRTVLLIATVCFILTQNITFMYYAVSIGLTLLMIPQLYVIIFKCKIPFKLLVSTKDLDIKEILKYGGVVSVTAASSIIIQNTDVLMTNKFLGFEKAGIYTIIFSISAALDLPRRILSQFLVPHVSHAWKDKNIEKIKFYYTQSSLLMGLAAIYFGIGLATCNVELFAIIPKGSAIAIGTSALYLLILARIIDLSFGLNNEILSMSNSYHYNLLLVVVLILVTVSTNYLLIPKYQLIGTALATLITIVIYNIVRGYILYKKYAILPFNKKSIHLLIALGLGLSIFLIPELDTHPFIGILVKATVWTLLLGGYVILFKIVPELNSFLTKTLQKFR